MLHKVTPGVKHEGGTDSLDADIDVESVSQGLYFFSKFVYPFPAVRPNLHTPVVHILESPGK